MALLLLRVLEFVLGGKQAIGYVQGLVVMCTILQVGLSAIGAMHLGKQAPGSKDQPRPRGAMSRLRMRQSIVTLTSCDPERINLHSTSIYAVLLSVLLLLHGCQGRRIALSFRFVTYLWFLPTSFRLVETLLKLYCSVYLHY